jgi:hypothetical protein
VAGEAEVVTAAAVAVDTNVNNISVPGSLFGR